MAGFAQNGFVYEALGLFKEMRQPDVVSWNTMITGFAQIGLVDEAFKLFKSMYRPNIVSWNAMLAGFAQNGFIDEAYTLFQKMHHKNVLSWTTMMAGFVQNGHGEEALRLFHQMELAGVKPDSMAFASILPACANFGALEQGMEIHEKIIRTGFQSHLVVGNALIDMYAKCGNLWKARELFDNMHERNCGDVVNNSCRICHQWLWKGGPQTLRGDVTLWHRPKCCYLSRGIVCLQPCRSSG